MSSSLFIVFADQSMVSGVNFLTGLLLARYLGIAEFGRFTLAWMLVLFVNSLQMALVSSPMMSIGPKQDRQKDEYFTAVLIQQLILGLFSFVIVFLLARSSQYIFPGWNLGKVAWPLAWVAFFFQGQDFLRRYFYTVGAGAMAMLSDAISYLGQLVLIVLLFRTMGMSIPKVLWAIAATSAMACIWALACFGRLCWSREAFVSSLKRHWSYARWIAASALLYWTSGNLFFVVSGALLGVTAVGAMKAAQSVLGLASILFQGIENFLPVRSSHILHIQGKAAMLKYLGKVSAASLTVLAAIFFIAVFAAEFWMTFFFGAQYSRYGYVLRWFAGIYVLMFLGFPVRSGLRALEYTRPIFISYLIASIFAVVMSSFLVQIFGLTGAMAGLSMVYFMLAAIPLASLVRYDPQGKVAPDG